MEQKDRKFETQFDGDEIDGKRYSMNAPVEKLDAPTAEYLIRIGRIVEIDDERFAELKKRDAEKAKAAREAADADKAKRDEAAKAEAEKAKALEAAKAKFEAGEIPADLIDAEKAEDADDRLIGKSALVELAKAAKADFSSNDNKADIATAIIAARAGSGEASS